MIEDDLLSLFVRHDWPGNVRQLENAISRLAVIGHGGWIGLRDLDSDPELSEEFRPLVASSPVDSLKELERRQIRRALEQTSGNRQKAAKLLGISKATIFRKIREYHLS
jgi:two-component system response regulator HydG